MSDTEFVEADGVAQSWLAGHHARAHTFRAYSREYKRLLAWALEVKTAPHLLSREQLATYFHEYAAGLLPSQKSSVGEQPSPPASVTVERARSILRRLFWRFVEAGIAILNPLTTPERRTPAGVVEVEKAVIPSWRLKRRRWIRQDAPVPSDRDPWVRAFAIAELAYWTGMRSSELAVARMTDINVAADRAEISIRKFGREAIETILLPKPALKALERYRISRGLPALLSADGVDAPLIARVRSELPVTAWTIRQSIKALVVDSNHSDRTLAPRDLRNELVATATHKGVPADELALHVRSRQALVRAITPEKHEGRLFEQRLVRALSMR